MALICFEVILSLIKINSPPEIAVCGPVEEVL